METEIYCFVYTLIFIILVFTERKYFLKKENHIKKMSELLQRSYKRNIELNNEIQFYKIKLNDYKNKIKVLENKK